MSIAILLQNSVAGMHAVQVRIACIAISAGIFEQSSGGYRNRVGIGLSCRPASVGNLSPAMGARNQVGIRL
jgi:hypothetical protein